MLNEIINVVEIKRRLLRCLPDKVKCRTVTSFLTGFDLSHPC